MLSMMFETSHPWITFKDACNVRSPQSHVCSVLSSTLCTEITLNTSDTEIAVCNLGSVNMLAHMVKTDGGWQLDHAKLQKTIRTAMRMLDNVIDINYYAVGKARNSNLKHRPVGLGIMGFQDCLHLLHTPYASDAAKRKPADAKNRLCSQIRLRRLLRRYFSMAATARLAYFSGVYLPMRSAVRRQKIRLITKRCSRKCSRPKR